MANKGDRARKGASKSTSRRTFIKAASLATVRIVAPAISQPSAASASTPSADTVPPDQIESALAIAKADAMYEQALAELTAGKFELDVSTESTRLSSAQDSLVGLTYRQIKTDNPRFGVDLALTIDLKNKTLNVVQYVVAWCLDDRLHIESTTFDSRMQLYPETTNSRSADGKPPRMIRPREVRGWDFLREEPTLTKPENEVDVGWPTETPDTCYWHYSGCTKGFWNKEGDGALFFRCAQVEEYKSCRPDMTNIQKLIYFDLTPPPLPLNEQQPIPQR